MITRDEQERMGLIQRGNFVPSKAPGRNELTETERGILGAALSSAGEMMSHRQQTHHAASEDSALTVAWASLFYSMAYGVAGALITAGILIIAYNLIGGDEGLYLLVWLVVWGACLLAALAYNRWQGLHFTPAGLAHHEIDSRERIAMHAIDAHCELIEKRQGRGENQIIDVAPQRRIAG